MEREEHLQGFKQYCRPTDVDREDDDGNVILGEWRNEPPVPNIDDIGRIGGNRGPVEAINQRDTLARYFLTEEGFIEWQWRKAYRGFNVNIP